MKTMLKKHKTLDKKLWCSEQNLHTEVYDILLAICWDFIDFVRTKYNIDIRNCDIKDIILFGSMTNYFYTKKSDIDICIVLDTRKLVEQYPNVNIMQNMKLYYYDWAMIHICNIRGRKLDINFEDATNAKFNGFYRTGGQYSLLKQNWILKPAPVSDEEFKQIVQQGTEIFKKIMHDYNRIKKNGFKIPEMATFYSNLMTTKRAIYDVNFQQVITPMYIAFNKLKKFGIKEKLNKKLVKTETKRFTLK